MKQRRPIRQVISAFQKRSIVLRQQMIADADTLIRSYEIAIADLRVYVADLRRATDKVIGLPPLPEVTDEEAANLRRILTNLGRHSRGDHPKGVLDKTIGEAVNGMVKAA